MTVEAALKNEIEATFAGVAVFVQDTNSTDEMPPYFVVANIDETPDIMGNSGRYQITGADTDIDQLRERMAALREKFHNTHGEIGGEEGVMAVDSKVVLRVGAQRDENGVYVSHIDLIIYTR